MFYGIKWEIYINNTQAKSYGVDARSIQRIAKKYNVVRTASQSNKAIVHLKKYNKKDESEKRVKRNGIKTKLRYQIISSHPYCSLCGKRESDGFRLEIDHIDENNRNNDISNLQVLCDICNKGKYQYLNSI